MAVSDYKSVLQMAASLTRDEQLRLIEKLMQELWMAPGLPWLRSDSMQECMEKWLTTRSAEKKTSVLQLHGLGAEIWKDIDAQEYVTRERSSWRG